MSQTPPGRAPIVVVANRGPLSFTRQADGSLAPKRAGGGLVASLAPAISGLDATWVATAVTEGGKEADVANDIEGNGFRVRHVPVRPETYRQYYDVIANGTLWFLHHNLFDLARRPYIDWRWWEAWGKYCEVNLAFADTVSDVAPDGATILVHDYHLTMLGKALREKRPDLKTVHFHHTPFTSRTTIDTLPGAVVETILEGLSGHDACGFHAQRWAESFALSCADHLGRAPKTFVSAAAPDIAELRAVAASDSTRQVKERLDTLTVDKKLIVRVDRIELSKNIVRGFLAYDRLLREFPQWRGRVTFAAFVYPSREGLPEYLAYRNEVDGVVRRINDEWGTDTWLPIVLETEDDFPRSIAGLLRYDVLLVNPIRDGLNLVAKEGAILNERNGAIVLSREAGSWAELSDAAIGINPFDLVGTADALLHALEMTDDERVARANLLREAAVRRTPRQWLDDQLAAAES